MQLKHSVQVPTTTMLSDLIIALSTAIGWSAVCMNRSQHASVCLTTHADPHPHSTQWQVNVCHTVLSCDDAGTLFSTMAVVKAPASLLTHTAQSSLTFSV